MLLVESTLAVDTVVRNMTISVVVPTRNRPTHIPDCVASVLATTGFDELIVIDQSDGTATEQALAHLDDPRLRYVRTDSRGVTIARNIGIDLSVGSIVSATIERGAS